MNIDIIVQARMGSKRLPGKVLMPIMGRPMLGYTLESMRRVRGARYLIVAKPADDEAIDEFCYGLAETYCGDETDVASRFIGALQWYGIGRNDMADAFVRICGDSPLIDWRVVNLLIASFQAGDYDLVSNVGGGFPPGQQAEVIGTSFFLANKDKLDREHVTPTLYGLADPGRKMIAMASWYPPGPSLVVDTQEDFNRAKFIIEEVGGKPWEHPWQRLQNIARGYERTRADQAATADGDVR